MTRIRYAGLLLCATVLLAACAAGPAEAPDAAPVSDGFRFLCGDLPVRFRPSGQAATLTVGERSYDLRAVRAASGARYLGEGVEFWNQGEEAMLVIAGEQKRTCLLETSVFEPGFPFTASGDEPPWRLELTEDLIVLRTGYSDDGTRTAVTAIDRNAQGYRVRSGKGITVIIDETRCTPSMAGAARPYTVRILKPGASLAGCGGESGVLLTGAWTLTVGASLAELSFAADGGLGATVGCNRISGRWSLDGEGRLNTGMTAATRMLCPPPVAEDEAMLLALLSERSYRLQHPAADRLELSAEGVRLELRRKLPEG